MYLAGGYPLFLTGHSIYN